MTYLHGTCQTMCDVMWCKCGGVAALREMNSYAGVHPHSQAGCFRISTWLCPCSGCARASISIFSKPRIASRAGGRAGRRAGAGAHIQQPATAKQLDLFFFSVCFGNMSTSSSHGRYYASIRTDLLMPSPYNLPPTPPHRLMSASCHSHSENAHLLSCCF